MSDAGTYPDGITPERLMAYADGALDAADRVHVEAALEAHPELAAEVEVYRRTRAALSGAFHTPMDEAVPAHLEALVMGGQRDGANVTSLHAERQRRMPGLPVWGQALAACAAFVFGLTLGGDLLGREAPSATGSALLVAGPLDADDPIARALETALSAQAVDIPGGQFETVATFPTASGMPCREFDAAQAGRAVVGLACRRNGVWTVEMLLRADPAEAPAGGFQLASGFDGGVIDRLLEGLDAGSGLASPVEACLVENGWDAGACS